MAIQGLGGTAY